VDDHSRRIEVVRSENRHAGGHALAERLLDHEL